MVQIQFKRLDKVHKFVIQLPEALNQKIGKVSEQFMKDVQKSARLRAPRMTGELAQSIKVRKGRKNQIILTVDSPYGLFQEKGFRPHWVHALMPTRNRLGTIGDAFNIAGFAFVSKHTPFIKPALERNLSNLPNLLSKGAKNAIQKARK